MGHLGSSSKTAAGRCKNDLNCCVCHIKPNLSIYIKYMYYFEMILSMLNFLLCSYTRLGSDFMIHENIKLFEKVKIFINSYNYIKPIDCRFTISRELTPAQTLLKTQSYKAETSLILWSLTIYSI